MIVVPEGNSAEKNAAMRGFGAELVVAGRDFDESRQHAAQIAGERGLHMLPSFHPDLVKGVATYALELFRAVADLDAVYVPIGMGSGICGLIAVRDLLGLKTRNRRRGRGGRSGHGDVLRGRTCDAGQFRRDLRRRDGLPRS